MCTQTQFCSLICMPRYESCQVFCFALFQESEIRGGVEGGEEVWGEPVEKCMHCFKDFPLSKMVEHNSRCTVDVLGSRERFKNFIPSVHDVRKISGKLYWA